MKRHRDAFLPRRRCTGSMDASTWITFSSSKQRTTWKCVISLTGDRACHFPDEGTEYLPDAHRGRTRLPACTTASHSLIFARNWLPRPSPFDAPLTNPAMSTNSSEVGTVFTDSWISLRAASLRVASPARVDGASRARPRRASRRLSTAPRRVSRHRSPAPRRASRHLSTAPRRASRNLHLL